MNKEIKCGGNFLRRKLSPAPLSKNFTTWILLVNNKIRSTNAKTKVERIFILNQNILVIKFLKGGGEGEEKLLLRSFPPPHITFNY